MFLQSRRRDLGQNLLTQILHGLHVWRVTKVAYKQHSLALRERDRRRVDIFGVRDLIGKGLS